MNPTNPIRAALERLVATADELAAAGAMWMRDQLLAIAQAILLVDHETPMRDPQDRLSFTRDPQTTLPCHARHNNNTSRP